MGGDSSIIRSWSKDLMCDLAKNDYNRKYTAIQI